MLDELVLPPAEWVLDTVAPEHIPDLAVAALERGCALPEIARLAGLSRPGRADVDNELTALLQRIGWSRPKREEAMKTVMDDRVAAVAQGDPDPARGAHELWLLANAAGFGRTLGTQLAIFVGLASEWADQEPRRSAIEAQIVEQARAVQAAGGLRTGALDRLYEALVWPEGSVRGNESGNCPREVVERGQRAT